MKIKKSGGELALEIIILVVLLLLCVVMLFPFLNLLAKSVSSESPVLRGEVVLWPIGFQTGTYQYVIKQAQFQNSLVNSIIITVVGSAMAMLLTCMTAYPLSKTNLLGRRWFILFFVFTMLFSGGMIPSYILMRTLGMLNTLWVLIIPGALSVYNMILLKNFFEEIPASVEESAKLDGARNMTILFKIVLPMSLPALATIGLFYAVGYWNNYMSGVLYITRPNLKPLQQYLYQLVAETQVVDKDAALGTLSPEAAMTAALNTESIRAATIMVSSIPIMCVYPFLQKYFVTGLRVGSVKG